MNKILTNTSAAAVAVAVALTLGACGSADTSASVKHRPVSSVSTTCDVRPLVIRGVSVEKCRWVVTFGGAVVGQGIVTQVLSQASPVRQ